MAGAMTLTEALPFWKPLAEAIRFVLPGATGVTVTLAPVEFAGTRTLDGTEITLVSNPVRETGSPPAPAGADSVIVRVAGLLKRFSGLGLSVIPIELAVIVTVLGLLLANPSLTI